MIELQIGTYNIVLWLKREWTLVLFLFLSFFLKELDAGGTTPFLEQIIIGRCWDYQHTQAALLNGQRRNCTELWLQFKNSFSNKPPCSTSPADFLPFINNAFIPVPENKVLMWTGVFGTVQEYAYDGKRYFVVSDTLPGYMLSNLHFCGQEAPPGINNDSCPKWGSCKGDKGDAEKSFWSAISVEFAKRAKGTVYVMLNGSSGNAYRNDSIFTLFELPHLNPQNVDQVKAFLIHGIGQPKIETCDTGTMLKLREDTITYGFDYECNENPSDIMFFLCVDDAESKDCKYISGVLGTSSAYKLIYSDLCVFISIAMLFRTL